MKKNNFTGSLTLALLLILFAAANVWAESVYINTTPEDITVTEGSPVNVPIFFVGGSFTGKPIELFVWKEPQQGGSGDKSYVGTNGWTTYTDFATEVKPALSISSMIEYAYVVWPAFGSSTGMSSFKLSICLDSSVNDAFDNASVACGTRNINITTGSGNTTPICSSLSVSPASITETLTVGGTKSVDITVTDSCGNVEASKFSATGSASWIKPGTPQTGKVTVTLDATSLSAGTQSGTVTITSGSESKTINVSLTVSAASSSCSGLTPSPSSITDSVQRGKTKSVTVNVTDSCSQAIDFTATTSQSWMTLSKSTGVLTVTMSALSLTGGTTYTGTITLSRTDGSNAKTINVSLSVTSISIGFGGSCTPSSVSVWPVTKTLAANQTSAETISVTNNCGTAVSYTASVTSTTGGSWLIVTTSGSGTMTATINTTGMSAGSYTGTVSVSSSGLTSTTFNINLTVTGPCTASSAAASPSSVSTSVVQGGNASATSVTVANNCGATLSYTVTAVSGAWITTPTTSTTGTGTLSISFSTSGLSAGTSTGSITVSTSLGSLTIPVTVSVTASSGGSSAATVLTNGAIYYHSYSPGQQRNFYFVETSNKGTGNNNSLQVALNDMTQYAQYNLDMVVRYSGATCDDSKIPTTADLASIKSGGITNGSNGFYFSLSGTAQETIEITSNPEGCYYVMVYNGDTGSETQIRLIYSDYDSN